jgi:hypothetical protein
MVNARWLSADGPGLLQLVVVHRAAQACWSGGGTGTDRGSRDSVRSEHPATEGERRTMEDSDEFETDFSTDASQDGAETADFSVDYEHSCDRRVDDALDRLARLPGTPLPGHADVYDAVHTELRAILSEQPAGAQGQR